MTGLIGLHETQQQHSFTDEESMATITLTLDEYDELKTRSNSLEKRILELTQQLEDERKPRPIEQWATIFRGTLEVIRYAIANLSPEFSRRWPSKNLDDVVRGIGLLPDRTIYDNEFALEITKFANDCEMWEARRRSEGEIHVPPPEGEEAERAVRAKIGAAIRSGNGEQMMQALQEHAIVKHSSESSNEPKLASLQELMQQSRPAQEQIDPSNLTPSTEPDKQDPQ